MDCHKHLFNAVTQFPQQIAFETTQPVISGFGNLTGLTPIFRTFQSFAANLPAFTNEIESNLNTIQGTTGSRTIAENAIRSSLEISRIEPIQFRDAIDGLRSFSVFPGTNPFINDPGFQRQIFDVTQFLGLLNPEQGSRGAIFAIRELLGGQVRSLERRFNIDTAIISQFAGESGDTLGDVAGGDARTAIDVLQRGLLGIFGGREALLRRGAQAEVQIDNIQDTLTSSIILPLISGVSDIDASSADIRSRGLRTDLITSLFRTGDDGRIPINSINPNLARRLSEQSEISGRSEEDIAVDIFGNTRGILGLLIGSFNISLGNALDSTSFSSDLSDFVVGIFNNFSDTLQDFAINFNDASPSERPAIASNFFDQTQDQLNLSIGQASDFLSSSGLDNLIGRLGGIVANTLRVGFEKLTGVLVTQTISVIGNLPSFGSRIFSDALLNIGSNISEQAINILVVMVH